MLVDNDAQLPGMLAMKVLRTINVFNIISYYYIKIHKSAGLNEYQ